jgi:hypothetical protein
LRRNTRSTYTTHHRTYERLCFILNIDPILPITERQLCGIVILYAHSHKITTVPGFIAAVNNYAINQGHPSIPRNHLFDRVKAGLNNWFGNNNLPIRKEALTLDDLCSFRRHLNLQKFEDARDWCMCLFAFYGLLRIREYANGSLKVSHVSPLAWGISLTIPFSKTSLIPTPVDIIRRDDELCPLQAYSAYIAFIPKQFRLDHHPFFLLNNSSASPMTDSEFISRIRILVKVSLKRDPSPYAGHSFRRGGASALFLAGVSEATIATHGRWKSLAYRSYFDSQHNQQIRLLATAQLRLHSPLSGLHQ